MMVTEGLLRHLTIPWKPLCQVMAVLGCACPSGGVPESQDSGAARAKEGIWVQLALHKPRKRHGVWAGEIAQSV